MHLIDQSLILLSAIVIDKVMIKTILTVFFSETQCTQALS